MYKKNTFTILFIGWVSYLFIDKILFQENSSQKTYLMLKSEEFYTPCLVMYGFSKLKVILFFPHYSLLLK